MTLNSTNIAIIRRLLGGRNSRPLKSILLKIEASDLAKLFSLLKDHEIRTYIDALMSIDKASDTLKNLPEPQLVKILKKIESPKLVALLTFCPEDDAAFFLDLLDDSKETLLARIPEKRRRRLNQLLSYPEDSAGRAMITKVFSLPIELTAQEAIDELRKRHREEAIYYVYCVDEEKRLVGVASLRALVTAPPETRLKDLVKTEVVAVHATTLAQDVAKLVQHYDLIAIPVIDENKALIGIITVDDVLDIVQEQATADIYASAGLQEDDRVYSPLRFSFKNRLPWMLLNLVLASLVSSIVSFFEATMSQLIVLATLNNIVAGIGGNTAIQTLTVVTRGIATGDFSFISYRKAILKELLVGVSLGVLIGACAGLIVYFWRQSAMVGIIICISMILNSFVASTMGAIIPIVLKKLNWDPASGSGVLVTFITDSFGFFSFLGIATIGLKYFS
jgi:magnesium transporter